MTNSSTVPLTVESIKAQARQEGINAFNQGKEFGNWSLGDDFRALPEDHQKAYSRAWIKGYMDAEEAKLGGN